MATLTKISAKTAAEIYKLYPLSDDAKKVVRENMTPGQGLDALTAGKHHVDAVRLLAFGLPKREAVWWACQCARQALPATPPPKVASALASAEKWVKDPSEDNRRPNQAAAEAAELSAPAGCAAMAAFMSGGSIAPPNVPVVPPGETLTAQMVAGAVLMAAVVTAPEKAAEKYQKFLALGVEIASGAKKW